MTAKIILPCSETRRPDLGNLPAVERYDGPAYRLVRSHLDRGTSLDLLIVSAVHGLLAPDSPIIDLGGKMTLTRAHSLAGNYHFREALQTFLSDADTVLILGGELHKLAVRTAVLPRVLPTEWFSHGGFGKQLHQLKQFCEKLRAP